LFLLLIWLFLLLVFFHSSDVMNTAVCCVSSAKICTIVFKTTLSEMFSTTSRLDERAMDFHLCSVVVVMEFYPAVLGSVWLYWCVRKGVRSELLPWSWLCLIFVPSCRSSWMWECTVLTLASII